MLTDSMATIQYLKSLVQRFSEERGWKKHHTQKNLAIALCVEASELLNIYKWKEDAWLARNRTNAGAEITDEIADIMIYILTFANVASIDLTKAVIEKMKKNAKKYPIKAHMRAK